LAPPVPMAGHCRRYVPRILQFTPDRHRVPAARHITPWAHNAHNHPSGGPTPSLDDRVLAKRLYECAVQGGNPSVQRGQIGAVRWRWGAMSYNGSSENGPKI